MQNKVLISLITAVYEDNFNLTGLVECVRNAKRIGVEWIVIDGGSADGTVDLLKNSRDVIDIFVSEPDTGIYEAWNKALKLCSGENIVFLGADDRISFDYFDIAIRARDSSVNILLFPTAYVKRGSIIKVVNRCAWSKPLAFPVTLGFPHSGTIHSRALFIDGGFDVSYRIAGDTEFLIRNSNRISVKLISTNQPKVFYSLLGLSETVEKSVIYTELLRIYKKYKRRSIWFYIYILLLQVKLVIYYLRTSRIPRN